MKAWVAVVLSSFAITAFAQGRTAVTPVTGTPQPVGEVHLLRQVPEACLRVLGRFTDVPAAPYQMEAERLWDGCQPRWRVLREPAGGFSDKSGWHLEQVIRVPRRDCPQMVARFELWKRGSISASGPRDGQGQQRIYLEQARAQSRAGQLAEPEAVGIHLETQGSCRG